MKNIRTKMIEAIFILKIDYTLKIKIIMINIILIKVLIKQIIREIFKKEFLFKKQLNY
jgi:hypothetical protein